MDNLTELFSKLSVNEDKIIKIQKWYRGCIFRLKRLPSIMYLIQKYLKSLDIKYSNKDNDGRANSYNDEDMIVKLLVKKFKNRIIKAKPRMWYDILAFDYTYGWLPINIKITTTTTSDNTGNLTMCVYAYTNEFVDIHRNKTYQNGEMSIILFNKIKNKEYNKLNKRDYYFIVLNKKDNNDIIINSLKGLTTLTPNINNLPFQVCWNKNRIYIYKSIEEIVKIFIKTLQSPNPSWKEAFLTNMRTLN